MQLCDESHQRVPKPADFGIWIDPETGEALWCEPYLSCIFHQTVEDVLAGGCSIGYTVSCAPPLPPPWHTHSKHILFGCKH